MATDDILAKLLLRHRAKITLSVIAVFPWFSTFPNYFRVLCMCIPAKRCWSCRPRCVK